jgi:UDP-N-acetylmuramyl pentapeptide synthase
MLEAIRTCEKLKAPGKIAVLGDMREVGESAGLAHREVMKEAMKVFDKVVLVGEEFGKVMGGLTPRGGVELRASTPGDDQLVNKKKRGGQPRGLNSEGVAWFENALEVGDLVKKWLKKDALVLVKGSQNTIFLETVVEELLADPADVNKLCRRGEYWDRGRGEWFETCKREQLTSDK